ncbi:MAG: hypothetical protein LDL13_04320 [Calditerrivibrio sp.]|nr:hypothetical protein [Calditerrivibrio sp.]MCA1932782.1 hypothetical protein [Calditerrivibrio sp.]MCA1980662.1 hypothetical protein [Calditerrivibrio sp.]
MSRDLILVPTLKEGSYIFKKDFTRHSNGLLWCKFGTYDIFIIGVSKVVSAINSYKILSSMEYDRIILTGIAGAYRESRLSVGDIVTIHLDYFVDEGIYLEDRLVGSNEIGFSVSENNMVEYDIYEDLKIVNGNTVSLCSGNDRYAEILHEKSRADVETMEGAAVGYVLKIVGKKGYHIRGVSNFCGERKKQEWNIKLCMDNLCNFFRSRVLG